MDDKSWIDIVVLYGDLRIAEKDLIDKNFETSATYLGELIQKIGTYRTLIRNVSQTERSRLINGATLNNLENLCKFKLEVIDTKLEKI
ncbi:hypothetical protein ES703_25179 [subsurface metagenome]